MERKSPYIKGKPMHAMNKNPYLIMREKERDKVKNADETKKKNKK